MRDFCRVGLCLLLVVIGCAGPSTPDDTAKKTCQKAADCSAGICDISTGACVTCLGNNDCGTDQVCAANKCEAKVACTSAKQCPGRVCAEAIGACSDCNADADCGSGKHCVANSCVPLPKACTGDAECTAHSLVCEPTAKVCVECAKDGDCIDASKPVCTGAHVCVARTCTPKAVECLDSATIRTCDTRGSAWAFQSCGGGTICEGNQCIPQVCSPGARRCDGSSVVKTCNAKGLGEDSTDCAVAGKVCRSGACADITCGDGIKSGAEECDDGNDVNTDACTDACTNAKCGDGFKQSGEECDDGNGISTDSCTAACKLAKCGDGIKQPGEACDDANGVNSDACTNTCRLPTCGDGIVQSGEQCDDGNQSNTDACTNACLVARCGDGFVQSGEQCDGGASCSATCLLLNAQPPNGCVAQTGRVKSSIYCSTPVNRSAASSVCATWGGTLVTLQSSNDEALFLSKIAIDTQCLNQESCGMWIGLRLVGGVYQWDGTSSGYRNWGSGEPSDLQESVALIKSQTQSWLNGHWNDLSGDSKLYPFACER